MTVIRTFIAIDLSDAVRKHLAVQAEDLSRQAPYRSVRWVPVNNIHLTLQFLGDIQTSQIPTIQEMLQSAAESAAAFEIKISGTGAFPSVQRPRVIWAGVQAPRQLYDLQKDIEEKVAISGILAVDDGQSNTKGTKKFSPHLTIGRVNRGASVEDVNRLSILLKNVQSISLPKPIPLIVKEVHLIKSDLRPSGAEYTRLLTAALPT